MNAQSEIELLLVDNDPGNVAFALDALKLGTQQFDVTAADGLEKALSLTLQRRFDLVLLDLNLSDSTGLPTLLKLRGQCPSLPIIVMSASDDEELALAAIHEGAQDFLVKSQIQPTSLRRLIRLAIIRKQADHVLYASEERFRVGFEHTNVAMVLTDLNHRFVRVNTAFANLFGYSESEMLMMSMPDITYPDDLTESFARREMLLAGQSEYFQMEKRYRRRDGSVLWCLTNVSLVRDGKRQPLLYVGQVQDISERKQAEISNIKYIKRLKILHQIDLALIKGEGPAAIATLAIGPLRELLDVPRAVITLFDWANGDGVWLAAAGRRRVYQGPPIRHSMEFMGDVAALRRGELISINICDLPSHLDVADLVASGIHAYVLVPMIAQNELIGALIVLGVSLTSGAEQISIAREVAAQFAIALAQARLHERIMHQAQELEIRVAELKQAQDALRHTQKRLEHVVTSSPAVLYRLECQGTNLRLTWISDSVRDMLGYQAEEALQPNWWNDRVHRDDFARVRPDSQRDLFSRGRLTEEYRFLHQDGNYRWVRSEKRLLRDAAGNPVEVIGSWSDITEHKQLEEQFHQAQKMEAVGQLAGGIAHDFNNLLTIILGYSDILIDSLDSDDSMQEFVRAIREAGFRATSLTRQLLAFSRKTVLEPKVLDLNEIVRENEKLLRRLIGEDILLTSVLKARVNRVKVDPGQLGQVLMNLAVNARDAMPKGGKLTLETSTVALNKEDTCSRPEIQPGRYVLLSITDTGNGMTEKVKARIFEPFFTTKDVGKGTGLGLAVVMGIVKQSGGHVEVDSEPEVGTTFRLYFPAVTEQISAADTNHLENVARGTETILLVEDEVAVRGLAGRVLRANGYNVMAAADADEAIRIVEGHQEEIELLFTDVVMPGIGGADLANALRIRFPNMKVLFSSGYTDDALFRHGLLQEQIAFIAKPYCPQTLIQKVRHVLDEN